MLRRNRPGLNDWSVPREWEGETVVVMAAGPSLTREQCEYVRGKAKVIAVNNVGIDTEVDGVLQPAFAPWADVLYAADAKWWKCYHAKTLAFQGRKVTIGATPFPELFKLRQSHMRAFDERPTHLCGTNSGHHALCLAVHLGAKRVLLLGFDMRTGVNGRRHYFGNHPARLNSRPNFSAWLVNFGKLAPELTRRGVEVINCSPFTNLNAFKRATLATVL